MALKTDLAEGVVASYAAARRAQPEMSGADRAQRLQDLVEGALERYGQAIGAGRGAIDQGYREDRRLLDWLAGNWVARASRVHAELLLDPESGTRAAMRRAMQAEQEVAA